MARQTPRATPTATQTLKPLVRHCLCCGETMWAAYHNYRTITTLDTLQRLTKPQGRVLLALDGLQPDVGHEVLWVLRDCLSGEVLLAQSLLSAAQDDLAELLRQVKQALSVPIAGVISDGQPSIRAAVKQALPKVPHQLCHFHYLRE